MDAARRFAANLIQHRKRANLTQEELGLRAAINRSQVGKLEMGKTLPRLDTLLKLAGALTVPVGDLTKGIAWKPPQGEGGGFELRSRDSSLRSDPPESI
jgi:transcriptional regulator with XRE-family HTH domain